MLSATQETQLARARAQMPGEGIRTGGVGPGETELGAISMPRAGGGRGPRGPGASLVSAEFFFIVVKYTENLPF